MGFSLLQSPLALAFPPSRSASVVETIERGGHYAFAPTYAKLMKDMYNNVVTSIRTSDKDIDGFLIRIRLHQGSTLTPYLFALVVDEVTRDIQGPSLDVCVLWTM
jgi:hypothetical protein